ncbi:MAG: hypothetical protein ACK56I_32170, partial [bacterium]
GREGDQVIGNHRVATEQGHRQFVVARRADGEIYHPGGVGSAEGGIENTEEGGAVVEVGLRTGEVPDVVQFEAASRRQQGPGGATRVVAEGIAAGSLIDRIGDGGRVQPRGHLRDRRDADPVQG